MLICIRYRPLSLLKTQWRTEISNLLEASSSNGESVFILGDFNCNILYPDKPPGDGHDLPGILDIFGFKCLINSPTHMTLSTRLFLSDEISEVSNSYFRFK